MFSCRMVKVVMAFSVSYDTLDLLYWYVVLTLDMVDADPEGIANAQKSLGLGQEDKARRVR